MVRAIKGACSGIIFLGSLATVCQVAERPVMQLEHVIELSGVHGGFDHFAFDPSTARLFLAAEDQGLVEAIDLKDLRVHSITGFTNPHSIFVRSGDAKVLVTDSGKDTSAFVDSANLRVTRRLNLAVGANCILYDSQNRRIYVTAGGDRVHQSDSTLQSIDSDSGRVIATVQVPALHLQPMAMDVATDRLFVNVADQDSIAIFDRNTLRRVDTWKIPKGHKNSPIVLDPQRHRLFVIATDPGILMQLNSDTGALESSAPTPAEPDDISFDASTQRIYVPGDGNLAVFDANGNGGLRLVQRLPTGPGARTGMWIDSLREYVVAVPSAGDKAAQVLVFAVAR